MIQIKHKNLSGRNISSSLLLPRFNPYPLSQILKKMRMNIDKKRRRNDYSSSSQRYG